MKKRILLFLLLVFMITGNLWLTVFAADVVSWKMEAPMPTSRHSHGVAAVGDKIYAIGGNTNFRYTNLVEVYDTKTGTWSTETPMPETLYESGVAAVGDNIYVFGGFASGGSATNYVNKVYIYNTKSRVWTNGKPMPTPRKALTAVAVGDKIYAIGGLLGNGSAGRSTSLEIYDTKTDTWSVGKPMTIARQNHSAEVVDNKIYVLTGASTDTVEIYDIKTNTWSSGSPFPVKNGMFSMATVVNEDKIYLIGGADSARVSTKNVYIYDTTKDRWTQGTPMNEPRFYFGGAWVNGKIYAIGGLPVYGDNNVIYNTVESLQIGTIDPAPTPVNSFSILLEIGQTTQIAISDDLSDNDDLIWSTENEEVAKVNSNGKVTATGKGLTKITWSSIDGSYKESILIRTKVATKEPTWGSINDTVTGDSNNQIEYSSNWLYHSQTGAYSTDETYTNVPSSYFQVRFNGTGIKWRGALNNTCGIAAVYLDGDFIKNVDCYLAARSDDELLFDSGELALGQHVLKVELLPDNHPGSIGNYITVDRIEIKE